MISTFSEGDQYIVIEWENFKLSVDPISYGTLM